MARPLVPATAAAILLALILLVPSPAAAFRIAPVVKLLFTPQAGYNSVCLTCGWHSECVEPYPWGPALDFVGGDCPGSEHSVYFRNFAFVSPPPQDPTVYVGYGQPQEVTYTLCKTVKVSIWDTDARRLGEMWYVHTYRTYPGIIWLYASENGYHNWQAVAGMAKDPDEDGTIPQYQKENAACKAAGYWKGVHLHEYGKNHASTFFLRNEGDCGATCDERYPCAPWPANCAYDPQDWWNDWVRGFCIDDTDCDGWEDSAENIIGTDPSDDCPDGTWDDAWPPDINNDTVVDIFDVLMYRGKIGYCQSEPAYDSRYDLNADGCVDIFDVCVYTNEDMNKTCTNP